MIRLHVRLFGAEAAAAEARSVMVEFEAPPTASAVLASVCADERLASLSTHWRLAVNHAFVADQHVCRPDDELAIVGLVSGG